MLRLVKRIKVCVSGHTQAYMCEKSLSAKWLVLLLQRAVEL